MRILAFCGVLLTLALTVVGLADHSPAFAALVFDPHTAATGSILANAFTAPKLLRNSTRIRTKADDIDDDDDAAGAKATSDLIKKWSKELDKVQAFAEEVTGKMQAGDKVVEDLKNQVDEALTNLNGYGEKLSALEQILEKRKKDKDDQRQKSLGERFASDENEALKSMVAKSGRGSASMEFKEIITSLTTDAPGSAGAGVNETRLPGIVGIPDRRMTVRDLLTPGRMDGSSLEYVKESGFTNAAAPVAETLQKPQSDLQFELETTSAKVIAHWMKASRQILDDFAQLRSYIDYRLRYGLAYVEETQLLNGDGTGQNLNGIIPQATAYDPAFTPASATPIDALRLAMLQAALAELPASGHVLNPIDWAWIETQKDGDGRYIIGNPQGTIAPTLWGLPVVATQAMAPGKFLTGAFRMGAQIFDRWMARVEVSTENQDDFIKNLVTILAEERLALAVYRPEAFIYGDTGIVLAS